MSLIQEALRRRQEETDGATGGARPPPNQTARLHLASSTDVAPAGPPPARGGDTLVSAASPVSATAPAPTPPPPLPAQVPALQRREMVTERRHGRWPALVFALLLLLSLAGGAIWFLLPAVQQWIGNLPALAALTHDSSPAVPAPDDSNPAAGSATATEPEVRPPETPAPQPPLPAPSPAVSTVAEEKTSRPALVTQPEPVAAPSVAQTPKETPVRPIAPPTPPEPPLAVVEEPQVEWPNLLLGGVVGKGSKGAAMLEGQVIAVGETFNGVKVISIGLQSAELEFRGQTRQVKVGNSTQQTVLFSRSPREQTPPDGKRRPR
jgi:hypothetical protein